MNNAKIYMRNRETDEEREYLPGNPVASSRDFATRALLGATSPSSLSGLRDGSLRFLGGPIRTGILDTVAAFGRGGCTSTSGTGKKGRMDVWAQLDS